MSGFLNKDNLPHLVQKLTDGDNIKITGNKHGDRVGKVVNKLIDKSNEILGASFKELKNEEYSFKTGEGGGTDLSNSTLDSFTTFALEGNTYKNLVKNGAEELVLNPEINKEGTGFELEGTFEGGRLELEVEGQTLKNLNDKRRIATEGARIGAPNVNLFKYQGEYTFIGEVNIKEGQVFYLSRTNLQIQTSGYYKKKFTVTNNEYKNDWWFYVTGKTGFSVDNLMILEGDYTQKEVPSFIEGVQGVGRKSKNLFNKNNIIDGQCIYWNAGTQFPEQAYILTDFIKINPNSVYTLQGVTMESNSRIVSYDENKKPIEERSQQRTQITTKSNAKFLRFSYIKEGLDINKIQLEEGTHATPYEPYFEGYKIGVKTHGKNLFNRKLKVGNVAGPGSSIEAQDISGGFAIIDGAPIVIKKQSYIHLKDEKIYTFEKVGLVNNGENKVGKWLQATNRQLNPNGEFKYLKFSIKRKDGRAIENSELAEIIKLIQLEEGSHNTSHESYKESTSEIILQDQLQGIEDIKDRLYFDKSLKVEQKIASWHITSDTLKKTNRGDDGNSNYIYYFIGPNLMPNFKAFSKILSNKLHFDPRYNEGLSFGLSSTSVLIFTFPKNSGLTFEQKHEYVCDYLDKNNGLDVLYVLNNSRVVNLGEEKSYLTTFNTKTHITQDSGIKGNIKITNKGYKTYNLLPNKEYTVMVDKQGNSPITLDLCGVKKVVDGDGGTISTSTNNIGELKLYGNGGVKNIRLLEGNVVNKTIGYFEGVQGVCGNKNLIDVNTVIRNEFLGSDNTWTFSSGDSISFKVKVEPNTTYTLSRRNLGEFGRANIAGFKTLPRPGMLGESYIKTNDGESHTFTTGGDINYLGIYMYYNREKQPLHEIIEKIQLVEGDRETPYQSYRDRGSILKSTQTGKNLFEVSEALSHKTYITSYKNGFRVLGSKFHFAHLYLRLFEGRFKKKTQYTLSYSLDNTAGNPRLKIVYTDGTVDAAPSLIKTSQPNKTISYIGFTYGTSSQDGATFHNIQLEEGSKTSFEPYEDSDFSVELEEPLMRLPNGVCDEITKDGKLIRRVGKIILTGEENWGMNNGGLLEEKRPNTKVFFCNDIDSLAVKGSSLVCDILPKESVYSKDMIGIEIVGTDDYKIRIGHSLKTSEEFKAWVKQNPITVWYQLRQPVVTDIKPLQARLFKNGHIIFDNKIAPISTYEVAVNKPAQINAGIKETQKLENRVNALEGLYDSMLLENSHILSNLEFDFSLMKEVEE